MTVKLNGKIHEVASGITLSMFIRELNLPLCGIAIAINYEVIPKDKWDEIVLEDGTALMMIQAVSGG
ncbi:MAG: sulfur carrier protein ThiS [Tannerella sp.]|jgi:sulfur carrier protein|nr:sulfur carrier protein ThiS [Tannerella sp.]